MRLGLVVISSILLIAGIVFEGFYLSNSRFTLMGTPISPNTYLVTGIIFIVVGLLLAWVGLRIPKLETVQPS